MYEITNMLVKSTPGDFLTCSSATATWAPVTLCAKKFDNMTIYFESAAMTRFVGREGTMGGGYFRPELYISPDSQVWFLHSTYPDLSTTTGNVKRTVANIGGGFIRLKYAVYNHSADASTGFRIRCELKNNNVLAD